MKALYEADECDACGATLAIGEHRCPVCGYNPERPAPCKRKQVPKPK